MLKDSVYICLNAIWTFRATHSAWPYNYVPYRNTRNLLCLSPSRVTSSLIIAGGQLTLVTAVLVSNHHLWVKYGEIIYASGGQNYLLLAMDMAKVGGPLSIVKVFTRIWTSQVNSLLLESTANFVGYSCQCCWFYLWDVSSFSVSWWTSYRLLCLKCLGTCPCLHGKSIEFFLINDKRRTHIQKYST